MASAQEFSSPGAHQASLSSSSSSGSSAAYRNPNKSPNLSIGAIGVAGPPIYYGNINKAFENNFGGSSVRDYDDFISASNRYNREYMNYNNNLFQSAMEYDRYMSNTAIQRQVQDLIAAGLNPVLAAKYGGATYHGVSAPYINLSPGSSLQAFSQNEASHYSADTSALSAYEVASLNNDSKELIAQYNKTMDRLINNDNIQADKDLVELNKCANEYLDNLKHLNDVELQDFGFRNQKDLLLYQDDLQRAFEGYQMIRDYKWTNFKNFGTSELDERQMDIIRRYNFIAHSIPGMKPFY